LASALIGTSAIFIVRSALKPTLAMLPASVGDLHAQHAPVAVRAKDVRGRVRLVDGDEVSTGPDGRARVRLDDGSFLVVDEKTHFALRGARLKLYAGRLFVQGSASSRTEVELADVVTQVTSSAAAFDFAEASVAKVYCAQGELLLRTGSRKVRVMSGETATLAASGPSVLPEKAFEDWTGGLAVPWAQESGQRAAIPEARAQDPSGLGAPLVVRGQRVEVSIEGEFAVTHTRTSYFNGSDVAVTPDVRVALPSSAILSRVAWHAGAEESEATLRIARPAADDGGGLTNTPRLEWAGNGWLRGVLPPVESGATVELGLTYAEWLPSQGGRRSYRFPLTSSDEPPLIGEFVAEITAESGDTHVLSTNAGAELKGRHVALTRSDFRPTSDLVVELEAPHAALRRARAYVAEAPAGEDPYVLVHAEVPDRLESGLSLAVVLDTSMSVGAGTLETERAVLDALLEGLGAADEIVVLAADQSVRAVGSELPRAVTPALRSELRSALALLRPGGASNLGLGLERGADLLDADARGKKKGSGVLVYVGDGRPTMGETEASSLRRRLSERSARMPRLASVAVGSAADRFFLARLTSGVGTSYEVLDRADAARVGANLLADALEPTLRDVEFELGPSVDRVYPRDSRVSVAGSTLSVVGRLRGTLPSQIALSFQNGSERVREPRALDKMPLPRGADLAQRWATARIEEITARGDGLEPTIALASAAGLLTPWTGWFWGAAPNGPPATPFARRLLELSPKLDAPFSRYLEREPHGGAALLEPPASSGGGVSLRDAAASAVRRILRQAAQSVRACRDARAAVRPDVPQTFAIDLTLADDGHVVRLHVVAGNADEHDAVLERCVEGVVRSLPYFALGIGVSVNETLSVPAIRAARRTQCSQASRLSLPIRRAVWQAREHASAEAFVKAAQACELASFTDKREYLLLMLEANPSGGARLGVAKALDELGETDAASFIRKETLRRVASFAELEELSRAILADEPNIEGEFQKAYAAATSDERRLAVVQRFLRIAPHAALPRRRLLDLLEALGHKDELVSAIAAARAEPMIDAGLLAQGASALRRVGLDAEGRRAFGELLVRAPGDPWTLAFVGDRLRAERRRSWATACARSACSTKRSTPTRACAGLCRAMRPSRCGSRWRTRVRGVSTSRPVSSSASARQAGATTTCVWGNWLRSPPPCCSRALASTR
jgi:Mg-chelatase subunit ChlD